MRNRLPALLLVIAAVAAWWFSDNYLTPWVQALAGYDQIKNKSLSILLGHWVFGQLPRVLLCIILWQVGFNYGLLPSLRQTLASGLGWRKVFSNGLVASAVLLVITVLIGFAAGGEFGFHPYLPKMAGDLVSNMYEEFVYRGLFFCSFYALGAAEVFPLSGKPNRLGLLLGTIGSCAIFGLAHEQYGVELQVVIAVTSLGFVYPWVASRSLWGSWIPHLLVDIVGDTILKL